MGLLSNLIAAEEHTDVILIEDDCDVTCSSDFVRLWLNSLLNRNTIDRCRLLLFEKHVKHFEDTFNSSRLVIDDFASDLLGWNSPQSLTLDTDIFQHVQRQSDTVASDEPRQKATAVLIDSVSNLILHRSPAYTCQVINQLKQSRQRNGAWFSPIVCGIHRDLHDEHAVQQLRYMASTVITLTSPTSARSNDCSVICDVLHKRPNGKVLRSTEEVELSCDHRLVDSRPVSLVPSSHDPISQQSADPTVDLTFNLSLSESEKQARSAMHLPYMKHKPRREVSGDTVAESKIFYQPDDADDFDDEDPDDDLDI